MGFISILAIATRLFGTDLFAPEFEVSIIYLPTAILLILVVRESRKSRSGATQA